MSLPVGIEVHNGRVKGRLRRHVVAVVLAVFAVGASGLSDAVLLAAETAMACCKTVSQCPAHAPHAASARNGATRHNALPPCCTLAPDSSEPLPPTSLAAPAVTVVLEPAPVAAYLAMSVVRVETSPRSSPVRRRTVAPHLLFSVFLL